MFDVAELCLAGLDQSRLPYLWISQPLDPGPLQLALATSPLPCTLDIAPATREKVFPKDVADACKAATGINLDPNKLQFETMKTKG